jgi:hypothetical protein
MRLNNPDDQAYIAKVVSDHFSDLIAMLPILRRGEGFVLGDSVLMPLRTQIYLAKRTPRSGDVDFFKLWSSQEPRGDITEVIEHWWRQDRQILNQLPDLPDGQPVRPRTQPPPQPPPPGLRIPIPDPEKKKPHVERTW